MIDARAAVKFSLAFFGLELRFIFTPPLSSPSLAVRSTIDCSLFHGRPRKPFGKWHAKLGPVGPFSNDPYCFRPRDFNGRRREATDDFAFLSEEKTYRECLDYSYHIIVHICIMVSQCSPWLQLVIEVKPLMMPARVHLCLFYWM